MTCGYEAPHFGAPYPDARCIDGYLWDLDSGDGEFLHSGGDVPCPACKTADYIEWTGNRASGNARQRRRVLRLAVRKVRLWAMRRSTFPCGMPSAPTHHQEVKAQSASEAEKGVKEGIVAEPTPLSEAAEKAGIQFAMKALEQVPKGDREALEAHITGVLIVFWGALWGTFGTEYARGFIEAQLRGMEPEQPRNVFTPPRRH